MKKIKERKKFAFGRNENGFNKKRRKENTFIKNEH